MGGQNSKRKVPVENRAQLRKNAALFKFSTNKENQCPGAQTTSSKTSGKVQEGFPYDSCHDSSGGNTFLSITLQKSETKESYRFGGEISLEKEESDEADQAPGQTCNLPNSRLIDSIGNEKDDTDFSERLCLKSLSKLYVQEKSWLHPLPWDENVRLALDYDFMELSMDVLNRSGSFVTGRFTTLDQLFDPIYNQPASRPYHILIRGDAGYGKTTLCQRIAYNWANGINSYSSMPPKSTLVLLFSLSSLRDGEHLEDKLIDFVYNHMVQIGRTLVDPTILIKKYDKNLMVILDGYDELQESHQEEMKILLGGHEASVFKASTFIVTSRPSTDIQLLKLFDRHYVITCPSKDSVNLFVETYFKNYSIKPSADEFRALNALVTKDLSPLMIFIICYVYVLERICLISRNHNFLYRCVFLLAKRNMFRAKCALTDEQICEKLLLLGEFFYANLDKAEYLLWADYVKRCLLDDYSFAVHCGVLRYSPFSRVRDSTGIFEAVHLEIPRALMKVFIEEKVISSLKSKRNLQHAHCSSSCRLQIIIESRLPEMIF